MKIESDTKIQSVANALVAKNNQLSIRNDVLERQAKNYALRFNAEKEEKKERQSKYEKLNEKVVMKTEEFAEYRLKATRRNYVL